MSDFRTGVNGEVIIDPNEVLGIEQDTDPSEDGVSVLLWPGRWRIRGRSLAGTGPGAVDVSWGAITGKPATFPPDTEATQDVVGSMIVGAGGTYDDATGTITLPSGGGGAVSSVAGRTGNVVLSSADLTDAESLATDAELTSGLAGKAASTHTHDDRYYTATEADARYLQASTAQAINAQTGTTYTLAASDAGKLVTLTNAAAITLTVPASTFTAGQRVDIGQRGAGVVTVVAGSGMTVNPPPGGSLVMQGQYAYASLVFISATVADLVGLVAAP